METGKRKIKILLIAVCKPGVIGGQATSARLLISHLRNKVAWTVISLPAPGQNKILRAFNSVNIFLHSFFICLLKRIKIVHLFTSCTRVALYEKLLMGLFLKPTGVKTIINFRGAFDEFYVRCNPFEKKMVKLLLRRQSMLLCQHDGLKKFLLTEKIVSENKINVIPNSTERIDFIRNPEIEKKSKRILCLSWIVSSKGLDLLIDAAAEIKSGLLTSRTKIEIYGPEEEQGLKGKLLQRISYAGVEDVISIHESVSLEQKENLLQNAILFVLPTRKEGFPNVILEAMSYGLPVITTRQLPMSEIVNDNVSGLLFEKENAADLAIKIMLLLEDDVLRKKMGDAGRKVVVENYLPEKIMSRFLDLYKMLSS